VYFFLSVVILVTRELFYNYYHHRLHASPEFRYSQTYRSSIANNNNNNNNNKLTFSSSQQRSRKNRHQ
jgi:hypothetical protein